MFSRKSKAERTAADAWDYLSSAVASAGDTARDAGTHAVDVTSATAGRLAGKASRKSSKFAAEAGDRVSSVTDEAWKRAMQAADALAGKRPGIPWGLVAGAALLGVAIGWAAATSARVAMERQAQNEELELAESAVVVTPKYEPKYDA